MRRSAYYTEFAPHNKRRLHSVDVRQPSNPTPDLKDSPIT